MDGTHNNPPRDLQETAQFTKEKKELLSKNEYKRLDDVLFGLDIALCRNPERYPIIVKGTDLRMFETLSFSGRSVPSFRIWYRFDDKLVYLLHIEVVTEE